MSRTSTALITTFGLFMAMVITAVFCFLSIYYTGPQKEPLVLGPCAKWNETDGYKLINGTYAFLSSDLPGYIVQPVCTARDTAVVVIHDENGLFMDGIYGVLYDLAYQGYPVVAPNFYEENWALETYNTTFLNETHVYDNIFRTFRYIKKTLKLRKVAVIGFGWGADIVAKHCELQISKVAITSCVSINGFEITPEIALGTIHPAMFLYDEIGPESVHETAEHIEALLTEAHRLVLSPDGDKSFNGSATPVYLEVLDNPVHSYNYTWEKGFLYKWDENEPPIPPTPVGNETVTVHYSSPKPASKEAMGLVYRWFNTYKTPPQYLYVKEETVTDKYQTST